MTLSTLDDVLQDLIGKDVRGDKDNLYTYIADSSPGEEQDGYDD